MAIGFFLDQTRARISSSLSLDQTRARILGSHNSGDLAYIRKLHGGEAATVEKPGKPRSEAGTKGATGTVPKKTFEQWRCEVTKSRGVVAGAAYRAALRHVDGQVGDAMKALIARDGKPVDRKALLKISSSLSAQTAGEDKRDTLFKDSGKGPDGTGSQPANPIVATSAQCRVKEMSDADLAAISENLEAIGLDDALSEIGKAVNNEIAARKDLREHAGKAIGELAKKDGDLSVVLRGLKGARECREKLRPGLSEHQAQKDNVQRMKSAMGKMSKGELTLIAERLETDLRGNAAPCELTRSLRELECTLGTEHPAFKAAADDLEAVRTAARELLAEQGDKNPGAMVLRYGSGAKSAEISKDESVRKALEDVYGVVVSGGVANVRRGAVGKDMQQRVQTRVQAAKSDPSLPVDANFESAELVVDLEKQLKPADDPALYEQLKPGETRDAAFFARKAKHKAASDRMNKAAAQTPRVMAAVVSGIRAGLGADTTPIRHGNLPGAIEGGSDKTSYTLEEQANGDLHVKASYKIEGDRFRAHDGRSQRQGKAEEEFTFTLVIRADGEVDLAGDVQLRYELEQAKSTWVPAGGSAAATPAGTPASVATPAAVPTPATSPTTTPAGPPAPVEPVQLAGLLNLEFEDDERLSDSVYNRVATAYDKDVALNACKKPAQFSQADEARSLARKRLTRESAAMVDSQSNLVAVLAKAPLTQRPPTAGDAVTDAQAALNDIAGLGLADLPTTTHTALTNVSSWLLDVREKKQAKESAIQTAESDQYAAWRAHNQALENANAARTALDAYGDGPWRDVEPVQVTQRALGEAVATEQAALEALQQADERLKASRVERDESNATANSTFTEWMKGLHDLNAEIAAKLDKAIGALRRVTAMDATAQAAAGVTGNPQEQLAALEAYRSAWFDAGSPHANFLAFASNPPALE